MNIINKNIDDIIPYSNNPRDNKKAVEYVKKSIEEFGFKNPVILDNNNIIVAGHTRVEAAKSLGYKSIPCILADDLTQDQINAFRLVDNKSSEYASWDIEKLEQELSNINLDMVHFDFEEVYNFEEDDKEFDMEEAVDNIEEPQVKKGERWKLGRHILMCGDSTTDDILKLMDGKQANLYLTDPPYNINVSNSDGMTIENDNLSNEEFIHFLNSSFYYANEVMKDGASFYIWYADTEALNFRQACLNVGWKLKQNLIWVKDHFTLGRQDYQWMHEPCLYGWKGDSHYFTRNRKQTTVINDFDLEYKTSDELREIIKELIGESTIIYEDKPLKNTVHPTMKPIPLIERLIRNSSRKGQIVLDSFGGSGTTLIACENLERECRTMEYDPVYAQVIINRFEELTGEKAIKIN